MITGVGGYVVKKKSLCTVRGNVEIATAVVENTADSPQKLKNRTTISSAILLLGIQSIEMKSLSQRDISVVPYSSQPYLQ